MSGGQSQMREQGLNRLNLPPYHLHDVGIGTPVVPLLSLVPHLRPAFWHGRFFSLTGYKP
jgi:hypothetical protein